MAKDTESSGKAIVRILKDDYTTLRECLLQGDDQEYAARLYAGTHQYTQDGLSVLEFLVTEVELIPPAEYLNQGPGIVNLGASTLRSTAVGSKDTSRYADPHAILLAHSHPTFEQAGYSGRDDKTEPGMFEALANDAIGPHGSLQVSQDEIAGRVWPADPALIADQGLDAAVPIDELAVVSEQSLSRELTANSRFGGGEGAEPRNSHARQALVTGPEGNQRLRRSHVAVVGAGGIGSLLIEDLANEGVGELTIIDPDVVEFSNLSRIPYASEDDAGPESATPDDRSQPPAVATRTVPEAGRPKVAVAADYVRSVDESIEVRTIPYPIEAKRALEGAVRADVLVAATDHTKSRETISEAGQRYLRPVFDAGSGIRAESGTVRGVETTFALTGPPFACRDCQDLVNREAVRVADRDPEELEYGLDLKEGEQPSVLAVNRYPAARAGFALYGYLTGLAEEFYAPEWSWDTGSTNLLASEQRPLPDEDPDTRCPRCSGSRNALRATGDRGKFGAITEFEDHDSFAEHDESTEPESKPPDKDGLVNHLWRLITK